MRSHQKKEVVFDFAFSAVKIHVKRRWLQRFYHTEEYRLFIKNTFPPEDHKLLFEATEKLLVNEEFDKYILNQVRKGRVVRSYDSQSKYLVYAENKFYIIQYKEERKEWEIKTVLTIPMILEKNYIKQELMEKIY